MIPKKKIEKRYGLVEIENTFIKSIFFKYLIFIEDRLLNIYGQKIYSFLTYERFHNEYNILRFIGGKITICVPKILFYSAEENKLVVERIHGITLDDIKVEHWSLATAKIEHYLKKDVLPQLRNLKSRLLGQLQGVIISPPRLYLYEPRLDWPRRQSRASETFFYCHNDLNQQNILLDPTTFEIKTIIDWEYSDFFLSNFEKPQWRNSSHQYNFWMNPIEFIQMRNQLLTNKNTNDAIFMIYRILTCN